MIVTTAVMTVVVAVVVKTTLIEHPTLEQKSPTDP